MSQTDAQARAIEMISDGNGGPVDPICTSNARAGGGSVYGLYPSKKARMDGVEVGTELVIGYLPQTRSILQTPAHLVTEEHWGAPLVFDEVRR